MQARRSTGTVREFWDAEAARFDHEPDHGLRDQRVRDAWQPLLKSVLSPRPRECSDFGCGTGSVAIMSIRTIDDERYLLIATR